jgi:hypothetical protein
VEPNDAYTASQSAGFSPRRSQQRRRPITAISVRFCWKIEYPHNRENCEVLRARVHVNRLCVCLCVYVCVFVCVCVCLFVSV